MENIILRPEDYRPRPPAEEIIRRYGIGIVGCGSIARHAHLPAYRDFGYRVVGVCDINAESARAAARDFNIPFWTTNLAALLEHPEVAVIDLAVPAAQRLPLVEMIAAAGKHILSQKPLALTLAEAERIIALCEAAGVTLMVNQQARWAPAHRALRVLLDQGVLGHLYSVLHLHRSFQDQPGSWFVTLENFNIVDHGIHYIDLARYFTGQEPERVKATTVMVPGQVAVSPMIYTILCEYPPTAQVMTTLHFNNIVSPRAMHRYEWFLDGTRGSACASQTELVVSLAAAPDQRQTITLHGRWFPDAFGGSMGEMLSALAEGREPATSGRDHLRTLRIAFAAVESAKTGQAVALTAPGG
ncbi:MAG TPA: Gfo/Idh/MocA family oxidoreductase [Isosphaeraceae bacterium]|nr:Gfo/Idh/MocA family oxidoreductase [Isosphaeraceae bacterium]